MFPNPGHRGGSSCPAVSRRKRPEKRWCGRRGSNPHEPLQALRIFMPLRLSPPPSSVRGLDYPFTVRSGSGGGAARLVSTPSRRKPSVRAWLGIAISGFPDFGQFCIAGFPGEHSSSPQVRCVCQFRHTRVADHPLPFMIGQPQALGCFNSRRRPGAVALLPDVSFLFVTVRAGRDPMRLAGDESQS